MNSNRSFYQITLQFTGGESDRMIFPTRLNSLKGIECLVYTEPTPAEKWVYSHASSTDFVVNSIVMIIATIGSIATIANFIYTFLKDRAKKKEIDRQIMGIGFSRRVPAGVYQVLYDKVPNKVWIKSDSKKVEISGDFSKDDIVEILRATSRIIDFEDASNWLRKQKTELDRRRIERELEPIEKALPEYRKLLELYEKDDKLESWQKEDYRRHRARMGVLKNKAEQLRKKLKQLEKNE